jgi:hypothetical protein
VIYIWCTLKMDHGMVKPLVHVWDKKLQENWPKMRGKGGVDNDKERLCTMLLLLLLNLSKKTIILT